MKKFLKYYHPMIFYVLYFFVLGCFNSLFGKGFCNYNEEYIIILIALTFISVFAIMIEVIIYTFLDERLRWAFLIFFFHPLTLPYYNLKYVVKEQKVNFKMIIFIILSICSFMSFYVIGDCCEQIYITKNHIKFEFYDNFEEKNNTMDSNCIFGIVPYIYCKCRGD